MNNNLEEYSKEVKRNIENLINDGALDDSLKLIEEYERIISKDLEVYSMKAVVLVMKNNLQDAKDVLLEGLQIDTNNFDLLYNLGYVYENLEEYVDSIRTYKKAKFRCYDESLNKKIDEEINRITTNYKSKIKRRIVFFVKEGLDSFLGDIIEALSDEYETKKIIVTNLSQIDEGMDWADICWFEWCDELIVYGSKSYLAKDKVVLCRLHRYEVFTNYPQDVYWENVDKLIIVTNHLKALLISGIPNLENRVDILTIKNGVDIQKFKLKRRAKGFNIAYIGYIHSRKNPVLLLQVMRRLVNEDIRYKLFIAGKFQEPLIQIYFNYQVKEMGLENNIIFDGWQNDINTWLQDKEYILSTSIHESFGYGIAEAMARGIKPIIHNFVFAKEIWDEEYLFNTNEEALEMIKSHNYSSDKYRTYIEKNYSLKEQITNIKKLINKIR